MFTAFVKRLTSRVGDKGSSRRCDKKTSPGAGTAKKNAIERSGAFTLSNSQDRSSSSFRSSSSDKDNEEAATDPLKAVSNIFTERPRAVDTCAWYVHTVDPTTFCFPTPESIDLPTVFGKRALEYAGHWIDHYYAPCVEECRKRDQLDLIRMLYHWYIAQFTIDYLNDVVPLTSGQYLASSALIALPRHGIFDKNLDLVDHEFSNEGSANPPPPKHTAHTKFKLPNPIKAIKKRKAKAILMASRAQMELHENYLESLVPEYQRLHIRKALFGFYHTSVRQCDSLSQSTLFDSMSLGEYDAFRTLNAGGEMGFLRQTFLFSLLDDEEIPVEDVDGQLADLGHVVGRNVALINDLYGLEKDILTGDPNIILKHHSILTSSSEKNVVSSTGDVLLPCGTSISKDSRLTDSIVWAMEEIKGTVRYIQEFYRTNPDHLVTRYNIVMGCVSGNHGCHATCKRFKLPVGVCRGTVAHKLATWN